MGFTPLEGLMMGSRSGSIDPGLLLHLLRQPNYSVDRLDRILNQESGLEGISGLSSDLREILTAMAQGSGLISILKNANKRSCTLRRESGSRTWEAGRLHRLEHAITGRWDCTKLPGLIRRREFRRSRSFSLTCILTTAKGSRKPLIK